MHGSGVVFGERVVLLGEAPFRLPGPLLIPAGVIRPQRDGRAAAGAAPSTRTGYAAGTGARPAGPDPVSGGASTRPGNSAGRSASTTGRCGGVWLPGPGPTVRSRADNATDPASQRRRARAAGLLRVHLPVQDRVDIDPAERLCPATTDQVRHAAAVLDLGSWRYQIQHTPPGPRLAALLDQRPEQLKPETGAGPVAYPHPLTGEPPDDHTSTADTSGSTGTGGVGTVWAGGITGVLVPGRATPTDPGWANTVLDTIIARHKLIAHLQAAQYADIAELSAGYPDIHQYLSTELAAALHTTDTEGTALLGAAETLRDRLPQTLTALSDGRIDDAKAMALVHATAHCSREIAHTVEQAVLPTAEQVTAITVRRRAGRAVIAADPDGAAHRHRKARQERHAWRAPDDDGMARLGLYAPAQDVAVIWEAITTTADTIKRTRDGRTLGQRRSDALTMICTDILAAGGWTRLKLRDKARGRPRINITVPYTVLLGHRAPCELSGHGPITTEQALPLIGGGDLYRLLCHPTTGQLLDYGHTRYRPPPHLAEFVRARDGECPIPTCHHPATRGDIDHITPAKPHPVTGKPTHGTTSADNLAPPCPHHHHGKDAERGFTLHRSTNGTYTWTTPLGRTYTWQPEPIWHPDTDEIPDGNTHTPTPPHATADDGDSNGHGDGDTTRPAKTRAEPPQTPVCDCPDTCPCQQDPPNPDTDAPPPLTIHGDWADGYTNQPPTNTPDHGNTRDHNAETHDTRPDAGHPTVTTEDTDAIPNTDSTADAGTATVTTEDTDAIPNTGSTADAGTATVTTEDTDAIPNTGSTADAGTAIEARRATDSDPPPF